MIKLKKISLHKLEQEVMVDQVMRCLKGGNDCTCGCHYSTSGGSSTGWNDATNYSDNKHSIGGGEESCGCAGSEGAKTAEFWH